MLQVHNLCLCPTNYNFGYMYSLFEFIFANRLKGSGIACFDRIICKSGCGTYSFGKFYPILIKQRQKLGNIMDKSELDSL